ncbi:MAG: Holliday junction branch migration protein RuvA [Nocardioidaceae bacterium]
MIASVRGRVSAVSPTGAVIEVGGIGIDVQCAPATLAGLRVGEQATLATSLVVREESLTLFGFVDADERSLFELVQTASGVGPKLAQAMLAVHGPDDLRRAVVTEDFKALTRVPGIGAKGAQRIVLELKDRVGTPRAGRSAPSSIGASGGWRDQVHGALLGLGWSTREADAAVDAVAPQANGDPHVPALLKAALQTLARA